MRNLTRLTVALMATVLLTAGLIGHAAVGEISGMKLVSPLGQAHSTLDENPVFWVKFISTDTTNTTGTVEVDATTGDIEFQVGGAADVSVSCPETDLDGVLDTSDAGCNTWIEIVDACNMGGSNWACVLGPVNSGDAPGDALATLAATDEDLRKGLGLYADANVDGALAQNAVVTSLGLYPVEVGATSANSGGNAGAFFFSNRAPNKNPFRNKVSVLSRALTNQTSTGTIAVTNIYAIFREYRGDNTNGYNLFERMRTVWSETGAATTVDGDLDFSQFPLISPKGWFFALETGSSTDQTTVNNVITGALAE